MGLKVMEDVMEMGNAVPDPTISPSDISFSRPVIVTGDQVTISATIHNSGTDAANNVAVRFSDNGTRIGTDQVIASIGAGGTGTASVIWNTRGVRGNRTIAVTADPLNAIREFNESNNSASKVVTVRRNNVQNGDFQDTAPAGTAPAGT